jgi:hypothetical protein
MLDRGQDAPAGRASGSVPPGSAFFGGFSAVAGGAERLQVARLIRTPAGDRFDVVHDVGELAAVP